MSQVNTENSAVTVTVGTVYNVYAGSGWTGGSASNQTIADIYCSGGTEARTTTPGDTDAINIPAGTTSVILVGTARPDGCTDINVLVDGVLFAHWNQNNGATSNVQEYRWYQSCFQTIYFTDGLAHTVTMRHNGTSGQFMSLDRIETYVGEAFVVGRVFWEGHSQSYGFTEGGSPVTQKTLPNVPIAVAARLGLPAGNVVNHSTPGSDLTNGASSATGVTNIVYHQNTFAPMPGHLQYGLSSSGGNVLWSTATETYGATGQSQIPQYLGIMHGFNDIGYTTLYDDPLTNHPGDSAEPQSPLKQVQALHMSAAATNGLFSIAQGGNTTAGMSYLTDVATINSRLAGATPSPIPFVATGALGSPLTTPTDVTLTANAYGAQTALTLTSNSVGNTGGGVLTIPTSVTGRNAIPAGAGWALRRFIDRYKGLIYRMNARCPGCQIIGVGIFQLPESALSNGVIATYNAALAALESDPTLRNFTYADISQTVMNAGAQVASVNFTVLQQTFGSTNPPTHSGHLTAHGASLVGQRIYDQYAEKRIMKPGMRAR